MEEPHFPPACKHSRYLLLKNNKHWLKNNKLIYFRMGSVYSARQQLNTYFSIAKRLSRSLFYCNFSSSKLDQWPLSSLGGTLTWGFWGSLDFFGFSRSYLLRKKIHPIPTWTYPYVSQRISSNYFPIPSRKLCNHCPKTLGIKIRLMKSTLCKT